MYGYIGESILSQGVYGNAYLTIAEYFLNDALHSVPFETVQPTSNSGHAQFGDASTDTLFTQAAQ